MVWMILAGVFGALAVFFVLREDYESAFVAGVTGAVCWFLNYREQIQQSLDEREEGGETNDDKDSDEEIHS